MLVHLEGGYLGQPLTPQHPDILASFQVPILPNLTPSKVTFS